MKLDIGVISFEALIQVDKITSVIKKVPKLVELKNVFDVEGHPITAYGEEMQWSVVTSITDGDTCLLFSDLNQAFLKDQDTAPWMDMHLSYSEESNPMPAHLIVTGEAYSKDQLINMLNFVNGYFYMRFHAQMGGENA